jgi:hypothetical protein
VPARDMPAACAAAARHDLIPINTCRVLHVILPHDALHSASVTFHQYIIQ